MCCIRGKFLEFIYFMVLICWIVIDFYYYFTMFCMTCCMQVIEELVLFYNFIYSGDYLALLTFVVRPYFNLMSKRKYKSKSQSIRGFVKLFF